jgi:hypothetical protein
MEFAIIFIFLLFGLALGLILGIRMQNKIWEGNAETEDTMFGRDFKVVTSRFFIKTKGVKQSYRNHIR